MYIHCCNRAELARCVETTVCHNCAQQTGTIDTCQGANAHWAMPHLSGRRSSLLKRVRFGYGSLTNLFSTTLSIQANSRVLTLTVSAKRKPVHSSYRDVTTKSERVIAHVIGSNLLWLASKLGLPMGRGSTMIFRKWFRNFPFTSVSHMKQDATKNDIIHVRYLYV